MHHKARTFFISVITFKEFDKCSNKETTKNVFDALVFNYEGSKQVQETKANLLIRKYELFQIEEDGDIENIFSKFQTLLSGIKVL